MKAMSSVSAAFGVVGFDTLNDLADWLDGRIDPVPTAYRVGRRDRAADPAGSAADRSDGGKG